VAEVVELTPPSSERLLFNSDDDFIAVVDDKAVERSEDGCEGIEVVEEGARHDATLEPFSTLVVRTAWLLLTDSADCGVTAFSCFPDSAPAVASDGCRPRDMMLLVLIGTMGSGTVLFSCGSLSGVFLGPEQVTILVTTETIAEQTLATVVRGCERMSVAVMGQGRETAETMSATAEVALTVDTAFVIGGMGKAVCGKETVDVLGADTLSGMVWGRVLGLEDSAVG
jgi:hypothetical protein